VVSSIENLLRRLIGEDIRLETVFGAEEVIVRADRTQLDAVRPALREGHVLHEHAFEHATRDHADGADERVEHTRRGHGSRQRPKHDARRDARRDTLVFHLGSRWQLRCLDDLAIAEAEQGALWRRDGPPQAGEERMAKIPKGARPDVEMLVADSQPVEFGEALAVIA
jgi:hypothetical protein